MFMTTNRFDAIDEAILSRMHIKIQYAALSKAARRKIWKLHLEKIGHVVSESQIVELSEHVLNGRAIANITYLASLMAGGDVITWDHLQQSIPLACGD